MNPNHFQPQSLSDFVGPARRVAQLLEKLIARGQPNGDPFTLLFKGPSGSGKSSLARYICHTLSNGNTFNLHAHNGTAVNVELIDQLTQELAYIPLDGYRCVLIDEADGIPPAAHKRMLTYLDRVKASKKVCVIATSNEGIEHFEERFQSRFKPFDIPGPSVEELQELMTRFTPDRDLSRQIASQTWSKDTGCNVRSALEDLDTALLMAA